METAFIVVIFAPERMCGVDPSAGGWLTVHTASAEISLFSQTLIGGAPATQTVCKKKKKRKEVGSHP